MATQTFMWRVENSLTPTIKYEVDEVQFGNGYKQVSSDGVNNKTEQYAIRVHARTEEAKVIMAFFDEHAGRRSFFWTPPLGTLGLYTCLDPNPTEQGGGLYVITGTFVKSYASLSGGTQ